MWQIVKIILKFLQQGENLVKSAIWYDMIWYDMIWYGTNCNDFWFYPKVFKKYDVINTKI